MPVQNRHEVHESSLHPNEGNVRSPDLIGSADWHSPEEVRILLVKRMRLRSLWATEDALEAEFPHERAGFLHSHLEALPLKFEGHLPLPVEGASGIDLVQSLEKIFIFWLFMSFVIRRRPSNAQKLALASKGQLFVVFFKEQNSFSRN